MSTSDPPVKIEDIHFNDETPLWNVQQTIWGKRTDPYVESIYATGSEDTFLIGLEEWVDVEIRGRASAFRIAGHPDYDNDPLTALAEYGSRLLAHVNGRQGEGWTLTDTYSDRQIRGMVEDVTIIRRRTEKYEFDYSLKVRAGIGIDEIEQLNPDVADPDNNPTLAGEEMGEIEELMINKRQPMTVHAYALTDAEDSDIESTQGAIQEFTVRGNIPGDESVRKQFDDTIRAEVGMNSTVWFRTPFPGFDSICLVSSHEGHREAGTTQIGQYNVRLMEGTIGSGNAPEAVG